MVRRFVEEAQIGGQQAIWKSSEIDNRSIICQFHCQAKIVSTATQYPHLTFDATGSARIERTRYKVLHLAGEHYHYGWTAEEILRQHPDLRREQVYAALIYFYDHYDRLVEELHASATAAEAERLKQPLSRAELLNRRSAGTP